MKKHHWILLIVVLPLALSTLACNLGGRRQPPTQAPAPAPGGPPPAPSNLGSATISDTQINLEWQDNAQGETGFRVYRAEGAGEFAWVTGLPPNTTTYQDQGLTCNTQYRYRVVTVNQAGESAPSNTVEAYTGMCP
jgi:hypothetical protein